MRVYLRCVNPALAVVVLGLCFWAATMQEGKTFHLHGIVLGGMQSYFFAKGLFSASAMFLLGRIVLELLVRGDPGQAARSTRREFLCGVAFAGLVASLLTGLFLDFKRPESRRPAASSTGGIEIVEHYRVKESKDLRVSGRVKNASSDARRIDVSARFFIDGKFVVYCSQGYGVMAPGAEDYFTVACPSFEGDRIAGDVTYELKVNEQ